jgi:hypothetical protein
MRYVWLRLILLTMSGLAFKPGESSAQTPPPSKEYQIKAVFLFHFAQFVEWPATAFPDAATPIRIGVLGEDPFGAALEEAIRGETIRNRGLVILRSQRVEDLKNCHLLFIGRLAKGRADQILPQLNSAAVLTVSESEGFAARGGVINFYLEGNKVRFEINPGVAQRHGLKISSQLLSLGRIIDSEPSRRNR